MIKKVPLLAAALTLISSALLAQTTANPTLTVKDVEIYLDVFASSSMEEMGAKADAVSDQDRFYAASGKIGFYAGAVMAGLAPDLIPVFLEENGDYDYTDAELDLLEPYAGRLAAASGNMVRLHEGR